VQLAVHDLAGRASRSSSTRSAAPASTRCLDGTDSTGRRLASGTYIARLVAGGEVRTQKLVLVK